MFIKLLGALVIVSSTSLLGIGAAKAEKYRMEDLEELEKALTLLKSEISFAVLPLPEAMRSVAERRKGVVAMFFEDMAERLSTRAYGSVSIAWEEAIAASLPSAYLRPEDIEALQSFGRTLGYLDSRQQLAAADICIDSLRRAREECHIRYTKNARMYKSMGLLSGILLAVVLL